MGSVDVVTGLRTGQEFSYRGRVYTFFDGTGMSFSSNAAGVETVRFKVFGKRSGHSWITVADNVPVTLQGS